MKPQFEAEPILEQITIKFFIAEVAREFKNRKKVRGEEFNKMWWKKKTEDVALVELGAWFRQMSKEGNGVKRQSKEVAKMLKEVEREAGMRAKFYPYWVRDGKISAKNSQKWTIQLNEIKEFLEDYQDYHFKNQTQLAL